MYLRKTTVAFGIFIILSSSFARQVMDFIKTHIGQGFFLGLVGLFGLLVISYFIFFITKKAPSFLKISVFIVALIAGIAFVWQMKIPEEKIHIFEFSILGWFAAKDLSKTKRSFKGFACALLFASFIGALDEVFQAILPYRFFQWKDIAFNIVGGGWGVLLYLLS